MSDSLVPFSPFRAVFVRFSSSFREVCYLFSIPFRAVCYLFVRIGSPFRAATCLSDSVVLFEGFAICLSDSLVHFERFATCLFDSLVLFERFATCLSDSLVPFERFALGGGCWRVREGSGGSGWAKGVWACLGLELNHSSTTILHGRRHWAGIKVLNYHYSTRSLDNNRPGSMELTYSTTTTLHGRWTRKGRAVGGEEKGWAAGAGGSGGAKGGWACINWARIK